VSGWGGESGVECEKKKKTKGGKRRRRRRMRRVKCRREM
jgi:hypothetical protein